MRITLFLEDKLLEFRLPKEISGSFSFDENIDEENKLINIEAKSGVWYLYATQDVTIVSSQLVKETPIEPNTFYELIRDNKKYLFYVQNSYEKEVYPYFYDQNINIVFGNGGKSNINYNCPYIKDEVFSITVENESICLNKVNTKSMVYVNGRTFRNEKCYINFGDKISIYGISIFFLKGIFLINNPNNMVLVSEVKANIKFCIFPNQEQIKNEEVKDIDLYSDNSYFSKSPRLRRFIEHKNIKLDEPPRNGSSEDMPILLTVGPMLTMGITSCVTMIDTLNRVRKGETTLSSSMSQLITGVVMLISTLLWPLVTKFYTKNRSRRKERETVKKYNNYLKEKEEELSAEKKLQNDILVENLIPLNECVNIIVKHEPLFWNKRSDEIDFLNVRIGTGNVKLDADIEYPESGFTIEENVLKKKADALVEKYKYIENVPLGYSLYDNYVTAVMGDKNNSVTFVNNILLQLITFYSYEDLKIVVFTNEENKANWDYIKYLYYNFDNSKHIRLFASSSESAKNVGEYLNIEINNRMSSEENGIKGNEYKPYYLIIVDDYNMIKRMDFVKKITENENMGFSMLFVENKLSRLPSKCNNFISLVSNPASILINSYSSQEQITFNSEITHNINMRSIASVLSNIPIEFAEGIKQLPDSVTFLEMEKVGKVEQLNILNRWNTNDSTASLKAEVGVDELGNIMYLDLHEKYHGPHGLIAGMTGSGKSEFIITYILSMAINYSPDYVSFILIDYKGGGLAGAFENKVTNVYLPHLAGTITNLDKSEMDRTLVSIDSEIKRRQAMFNEARDNLGESTIDIYKYQKFYKEKKVETAIPHLFIICDEFAELKSQQPDFMENLISVARIGRSLGVHLILATQKPSGVVNDQIWSNTKFRVCLKVQDAQDSNEVLKKPDAASLKQIGRFYLEVGYDEYYALGQSAWCGAKYYPSSKIVRQIDKSINFINEFGAVIKSAQASSNSKKVVQGEQISAIMKNIIEVSNQTGMKAKRLWLENISPIILVDNIIKKYNIQSNKYDISAILGEYDAPEKQEQGVLLYSFIQDGNTIIYGLDGGEREMLLNSIIYSTIISHTSEEINYYIIDYGSESLRRFAKFPQIGGMVFAEENDKFTSLLKLIRNEINTRKRKYANYNGDYLSYIKTSETKDPLKIVILNNFDSIYDSHQDLYDELPTLVRDSERYGIIFILTANGGGSVSSKISQNFGNVYSFRLKDSGDYMSIFDTRAKSELREIYGRGFVSNDGLHEFQSCSIVEDNDKLNDFLNEIADKIKNYDKKKASVIPTLPDIITFNIVKDNISSLNSMPVGISKQDLEIVNFDFTINAGTVISSNRLLGTTEFIKNLVKEFSVLSNTQLLFIDGTSKLSELKENIKYFYDNSFDKVLDSFISYFDNLKNNSINQVVIIYGIDKFISKLEDKLKLSTFIDTLKKNEQAKLIIVDGANKIKDIMYETWYQTTFSNSDGIWIGKGVEDQGIFKLGNISRDLMINVTNKYGIIFFDGTPIMTKLIDFNGGSNEK